MKITGIFSGSSAVPSELPPDKLKEQTIKQGENLLKTIDQLYDAIGGHTKTVDKLTSKVLAGYSSFQEHLLEYSKQHASYARDNYLLFLQPLALPNQTDEESLKNLANATTAFTQLINELD